MSDQIKSQPEQKLDDDFALFFFIFVAWIEVECEKKIK